MTPDLCAAEDDKIKTSLCRRFSYWFSYVKGVRENSFLKACFIQQLEQTKYFTGKYFVLKCPADLKSDV